MDPITIALAIASQFAPGIIKYFGGGDTAGIVAGKVIDIAKAVTGNDTPEAALRTMQLDPVMALAFKQSVLESEADLEKAYLGDRADARRRDLEMVKETGTRNRRADYMVVLDVVGLIACLVVLIVFRDKIPGEVVGLLSTIASIFGLCLRDAHQFEFGSSRGSKDKTEMMALK